MSYFLKVREPLKTTINHSMRWSRPPALLSNDTIFRCLSTETSSSKFSDHINSTMTNFKDVVHSPPAALFYGISGLIPFLSIPAYMLGTGVFIPELAYSQLAYGAVILSFLGGARWGATVSYPKVSINSSVWLQTRKLLFK